MSCNSQCSVALPCGVVGWSALCDCGISWLNSLVFYTSTLEGGVYAYVIISSNYFLVATDATDMGHLIF